MEKLRLIINEDEQFDFGLEQSYFVKNTHAQNRRFKMLPYTTKSTDFIADFTGVIGEFIRMLSEYKLSEKFDISQFNMKLKEIIEDSNEKDELLSIIECLFIENGSLSMFDLKSYNYVKSTGSESKMAQFLYTIFVDNKIKTDFQMLNEKADTNILHKLVYDALPDLVKGDYHSEFEKNKYQCLIPYVKERFTEDFIFLMTSQELIEKYMKRILEYYYMFYITQLVIKLNHFERVSIDDVEKIYMTLSWEVTSQTRRSYQYGWQYVKQHLEKLFSHAITFEILAHNNLDEKYTYTNINEIDDNNSELIGDISWFINRYKEMKKDVDFTAFKFDESERSESEVTTKVKELFQVIYYQFCNSDRGSKSKAYADSVTKFVYANFGKFRGRSGYTFNITENDIIMFVQIVLGQNNGRVRLVTLFSEFEARGLLFDRESRNKIVDLLEKLNLLEKKSDSGDAQYVRSIL